MLFQIYPQLCMLLDMIKQTIYISPVPSLHSIKHINTYDGWSVLCIYPIIRDLEIVDIVIVTMFTKDTL